MKKYLITGALALVACATLTSCHSDDELSGSLVQQKLKAYEQVFEEEFGKVDPNQDWGFGTAEILARTRTTMARTRAENANANEWADPNKDYGGLLVPPAITPTQAAVVKTYFQTHPDLDYDDPKWTNYFIQQVYKGHTSVPEGCATPEEYTALNGTTKLIASDYMDHLAAIDGTKTPEFVDHINNFNHGDCGENDHVLDNGGNANDGPFHTDKIMYMKNSTTKSFGYYNSNGSLRHTEYTALVGWKTIHDWAVTNYPGYDGCLNDTWNRSFMGFDFEQMIDDQCYATKYVDGQEVVKNLTINEYSLEYYVNGEKTSNYVYQYNNQPVKMLSDQMNRYCGEKIEVTDAQLYSDYRVNGEYLGKQLNTDFIDGLLADGYLPIDNKGLREWAKVGGCADGYYSDWIVTLTEANAPGTTTIPIEPGSEGSDERKDVYYKKVSFDKAGSGRVFCEDLGVVRASDIDFNDIVFDVLIYKTELITKHMVKIDGDWVLDTERYGDGAVETTSTTYDGDIWLLAGGGTIPATIQADGNNYNVKQSFEYQLSDKVIVNTIEDDGGSYGNQYKNDSKAKKLNDTPLAITSVADAKIFVTYGAEFAELTAYKGVAPHKICVPLDTKWLKEREEISNGYPNFTKYVKYQDADGNSLVGYINNPGVTENDGPEGGYVGDGNEYSHDERANSVWETYNESSLFMTPTVTYTARHEVQGWREEEVYLGESDITGGGTNSGYRNGDPVLIRRRN